MDLFNAAIHSLLSWVVAAFSWATTARELASCYRRLEERGA